MAFLSWLANSKVGRMVALIGSLVFGAFLLLASSFKKGAASEKSKQTESNLNAQRDRDKIDDSITKKPLDVRRDELARWMRNDQ